MSLRETIRYNCIPPTRLSNFMKNAFDADAFVVTDQIETFITQEYKDFQRAILKYEKLVERARSHGKHFWSKYYKNTAIGAINAEVNECADILRELHAESYVRQISNMAYKNDSLQLSERPVSVNLVVLRNGWYNPAVKIADLNMQFLDSALVQVVRKMARNKKVDQSIRDLSTKYIKILEDFTAMATSVYILILYIVKGQ